MRARLMSHYQRGSTARRLALGEFNPAGSVGNRYCL